MKKIIWPLIIILFATILFVPMFRRPLVEPKCICFIAGPCSCNTEWVSLLEIIKNKVAQ